MTPDIREGDRTAAFDAALVAYRPDSHYVPPLWSDFVRFREELLHHRRPRRYALFSALRDGRPVGRIAASIHDDSNRKHGTYNGAFGFFDCIDDADVADALLGKAEGWQPIKRSGFKVRLEDARIILNDGFADNPMFVPPTAAEYLFQAGDMMWIIDKRISTVVYHRGRPAGAIIAIPDLNPLVKSSGGKVGLIAPLRFLQHRTRNNRAVLIYQSVCRELHNCTACISSPRNSPRNSPRSSRPHERADTRAAARTGRGSPVGAERSQFQPTRWRLCQRTATR